MGRQKIFYNLFSIIFLVSLITIFVTTPSQAANLTFEDLILIANNSDDPNDKTIEINNSIFVSKLLPTISSDVILKINSTGSILISKNGVLENNGTILISGSILNSGKFLNQNKVIISNEDSFNTATFTNSANGVFINNGYLKNANAKINNLSINIFENNNTLENLYTFNNTGVFYNQNGSILINKGVFENLLQGKTFNFGDFQNLGTIKNDSFYFNNESIITSTEGVINELKVINNINYGKIILKTPIIVSKPIDALINSFSNDFVYTIELLNGNFIDENSHGIDLDIYLSGDTMPFYSLKNIKQNKIFDLSPYIIEKLNNLKAGNYKLIFITKSNSNNNESESHNIVEIKKKEFTYSLIENIRKELNDEAFQLIISVFPATSLYYQSENNNIVMISNDGLIKINGVGEAKISVKGLETETHYGFETYFNINIYKNEPDDPPIDEPDEPSIDEPDEPSIDELDEPSIDEPDEPSIDEPDEPSIDEPDEPSIDEPDEPSIDEPDEPSIDEPDEPSIDEPDEPSIDEPSIDEPDEPSIDEPDEPSIDEPDEPSIDEPDEPSIDEPDEPSIDEPDEPSIDEPDEPSIDEPDEPSIDEPDEPSIDEPDEPSIDEPDVSNKEIINENYYTYDRSNYYQINFYENNVITKPISTIEKKSNFYVNKKFFNLEHISFEKEKYSIYGDKEKSDFEIPYLDLNFITLKNKDYILKLYTNSAFLDFPVDFSNYLSNSINFIFEKKLKLEELNYKVSIEKININNIKNTLKKDFKYAKPITAIKYNINLYNYNSKKILKNILSYSKKISKYIKIETNSDNLAVFKYNEKLEKWFPISFYIINIDSTEYIKINSYDNGIFVIAENMIHYDDVDKEFWAYSQINEASKKGFINEKTNNNFAPNEFVTKAEFIEMLLNISDMPNIENKELEYKDVDKYNKYYDSIMKAKNNKLLEKLEKDNFYPEDEIKREEIAIIISNVLNQKQIPFVLDNIIIEKIFTDHNDITYKNEVMYVYKNNIMFGKENLKFKPHDFATRAEIANLIINLNKIIN